MNGIFECLKDREGKIMYPSDPFLNNAEFSQIGGWVFILDQNFGDNPDLNELDNEGDLRCVFDIPECHALDRIRLEGERDPVQGSGINVLHREISLRFREAGVFPQNQVLQ